MYIRTASTRKDGLRNGGKLVDRRRGERTAQKTRRRRRDAALPPFASYGLTVYSCIIRVYVYVYAYTLHTRTCIRTYLQLDSSFQQYLYQIDVLLLDGDDERASV